MEESTKISSCLEKHKDMLNEKFTQYIGVCGNKNEKKTMSLKTFKYLIRNNETIGHVYIQDIFEAFNKFCEGSCDDGYLTFGQFMNALRYIIGLMIKGGPSQCCSDTELGRMTDEVCNGIKDSKPSEAKVSWKKFISTFITGHGYPSNTEASYVQEVAKSVIKEIIDLASVLPVVGPYFRTVRSVWVLLQTFDVVSAEIHMFADNLQYLTDTLLYIEENGLYKTKIMEKRIAALEYLLDDARKFLDQTKKNGKIKEALAKGHTKEKLNELNDRIRDWLSISSLIQLAESKESIQETLLTAKDNQFILQQLMAKLDKAEDRYQEIMDILRKLEEERTKTLDEKESRDVHGPAIEREDDNVNGSGDFYPSVDRGRGEEPDGETDEMQCDFLIYHEAEDEEIARDIKQHLQEKVPKIETRNCNSHPLKVKCLGEYHHYGKPQIRLEKALEASSLVLILVTENLAKANEDAEMEQAMNVYAILSKFCPPGQACPVFALMYDSAEITNTYKSKLDFYVRTLIQANVLYRWESKQFDKKMAELYCKNYSFRLEREKVLKQKIMRQKEEEGEQKRKLETKQQQELANLKRSLQQNMANALVDDMKTLEIEK